VTKQLAKTGPPSALDKAQAQDPRKDMLGLALGGLSEATIRTYSQQWARFAAWAGEADPEQFVGRFLHLTKAQAAKLVDDHGKDLRAVGAAPNTTALALRAIVSMVHRWHLADVAPWTLKGLVRITKVRQYKDTQGPSLEVWRAVLQVLEAGAATGTPRGVRDLAVALLLRDSGLRRREVATLRVCDARVAGVKPVVCVWTKGAEEGDRDAIPLAPRQAEAVAAWLEVRDIHVPREPHDPLFLQPDAMKIGDVRRMTEDDVFYVVNRAARKANVERFSPHKLRHHAITRLAEKGVPVPTLKEFARHRDVNTTMRYVHATQDVVGEVTEQLAEDD